MWLPVCILFLAETKKKITGKGDHDGTGQQTDGRYAVKHQQCPSPTNPVTKHQHCEA